jgi:hypothetical protein
MTVISHTIAPGKFGISKECMPVMSAEPQQQRETRSSNERGQQNRNHQDHRVCSSVTGA